MCSRCGASHAFEDGVREDPAAGTLTALIQCVCPRCQTLRSVWEDARPRCGACHARLLPWDGRITPEHAAGPCPRCGGPLSEDPHGPQLLWD